MPDGTILAVAARGTLTGNRGILHDDQGRLGRARWRHPHWIACELQHKGLRRPIMAPGHWTELFFLDEAVALAAGHRPCALCRRADHAAFGAAWARAFGAWPKSAAIDRVLHGQRVTRSDQAHMTHEDRLPTLPDGTFIRSRDGPMLVLGDALLPFAPDGYGPALPRPGSGMATVLTPRPIVAVLAAGYRPRLHASTQ